MTLENPTPEMIRRAEELGEQKRIEFEQSLQINYDNMFLRQCSKCLRRKPNNEFYRDMRLKSGRRKECKECESARKAALRARTEKPCRTCGEVKPMDEYRKHNAMPDGRFAHCKDCMRAKENS